MASRRDPVKRLLALTKYRAKRRGIPFDLDEKDVEIPPLCPVLGIPLYRNIGERAQGPNSPTVDRINPSLGYVRGNVQIISSRANQIKSDASPEELLRVATFMQEHGAQLINP